ncbi:alpha/beta hydrolase [Nocardioides eburneiflavus]|uniref:Alpha/beta hydrolase n=1 Tax=Nocardioides eburneiflavus TaxID=2518372 RepID=A0A4Z1C3Q0_9ACTN|nr:alpha/beta hydrolase [Nocardioides eburneiflavus]TGN63652.1 alpha/beta hydrolase [Nocardioides eburneiflavus]
MRRRTLLAVPALGLVPAALLSACSDEPAPGRGDEAPGGSRQDGAVRITYGTDPSQLVALHRPSGASRGVVVVIHGGFWKSAYDHTLGTPLARSLAEQGWTAWNIEYRRVGNGGGTPETFDDVAAAIDALADVDDLDLSTVVTLGHSAGGHLAVWAAGRPDPAVRVTHTISQAGVLDLVASERAGLGGGAAASLLGHTPGPDDAQWDPRQQVPLDVPVWAVHAPDDDTVPFAQATAYVDAATAAGAEATLVEVTGGHFGVIDPSSPAWTAQLEVLDTIG